MPERLKLKPEPQSYESMLKERMEEEQHKYDFKYLKRRFKSEMEMDEGAYLKGKELWQAVRDPLVQRSADKLLNLWQNYKFSFELNGMEHGFELFRRVARVIPISKEEGGTRIATHFKYEFRNREDPRFMDRRM